MLRRCTRRRAEGLQRGVSGLAIMNSSERASCSSRRCLRRRPRRAARWAGRPAVRMIADEGEAARLLAALAGTVRTGARHRQRLTRTRGPPRRTCCGRSASPGSGNSSPIVWGDRIFLTTAHDGGRRLSVLAFRRSDGGSSGRRLRPPGRTDSARTSRTATPRPTPATDGERVYVSFGSRGLFAFDLDGKLLWQRDLGRIEHYHGTAGSPLLYKDRIILYQDQSVAVRSSRRSTREPATADLADARDERRSGGARRSPFASAITTRSSSTASRACMAYDPDTRPRAVALRRHELRSDPDAGRRLRHGVLRVRTRRPDAGDPAGRDGRRDEQPPRVESPRGSPFVPSPILYGEHLYMVNDMASIVTAFEATTGTRDVAGPAGRGAARRILGVTGRGRRQALLHERRWRDVRAAGRRRRFELLHVNRIGERTLASPALVDGRWYIRTDQHLFAIGRR